MDISSATQLLSGLNNQQPNQTSSPIPGAPPASPAPTSNDVGTDFGAAGTYQQGQQAPVAETFAPDMGRVRELWNSHQDRVDSFRRMVEQLLGQQAERQGLADGWNLRDIEITPEMRAEANEMLGEGGYFSVEETAARMLDFAVALTGGDPARIEVMRDAVQRGFAQAERMFGGELPEISHQTLEAVMNGFDEWAEAGSASAITLLNR
ncbi:MAG: hypothetical protein FWC89_10085 [Defluviitaleaceae bacterium]|nr:hypothetical protein [Defluviitaleaceae bacterium]